MGSFIKEHCSPVNASRAHQFHAAGSDVSARSTHDNLQHDEPRIRPAAARELSFGSRRVAARELSFGSGWGSITQQNEAELSTRANTLHEEAWAQLFENQQARLQHLLTEQMRENRVSLEDAVGPHMATLSAQGNAASRELGERLEQFARGLRDVVTRSEEALEERLTRLEKVLEERLRRMQVQFGAGLRSINDESTWHLEEIMRRGIEEQKVVIVDTACERREHEGAGTAPASLSATMTPEKDHHHREFGSSVSYQSGDQAGIHGDQAGIHDCRLSLEQAKEKKRPSVASWEHDWEDALDMIRTHTFHLAAHPDSVDSKTWDLLLAKFGLLGTLLAFLGIAEPDRSGPLARLESRLRYFFLAVILANAAFMIVTVNYEVNHPHPQKLAAWMETVELVFLATFSVELLLKLSVHRLYFFVNHEAGWNWLDLSLVTYGIIEHIVMAIYESRGVNGITFLRVMRIFKVAKVLRVFRLVSSFRQLRLIFVCLLGSFHTLLWSIAFMAFIYYVFSLLLVQGVASFLASEQRSLADTPHTELAYFFGSVEASMLTLYRAGMGGDDWSLFYEVMREAGMYWSYLATYLFFIAFTQIAMLNIITGVFVDSAMQQATPSHFQQSLNLIDEEAELAAELGELVAGFDTNGDGYMDQNAFFCRHDGHPVNTYLRFLGVDDQDLQRFLETTGLIHEKGVLIQEFVQGVMKLKGSARNLDMQASLFQLDLMRKEHARTHAKVENMSRHLGIRIEDRRPDSK